MNRSIIFSLIAAPLHCTHSMAASPCNPADPAVVCTENAEDLIRLRGTRWIVASHRNFAMEPPFKASFGPVMAIRVDTHEVRTLYPMPQSAVDWDKSTYPDCPSPPESISSHGVNARQLGGNRFRLYIANHGNRQSVEIIDVAVHGEQLMSTWRGCARSPEGIFPNGVVPLPGGGFALSGFGVAIWMPGKGWSPVNQIKGSNGIEVSRDGRWLFVADDGTKTVIRVPVNGQGEQKSTPLDFLPDNLRWGEDGQLYVAGPYWPDGFAVEQCLKAPDCALGFRVAQLDVGALRAKEIVHSDGIQGLRNGATTALQIGDAFWIGTALGDRVAIMRFRD